MSHSPKLERPDEIVSIELELNIDDWGKFPSAFLVLFGAVIRKPGLFKILSDLHLLGGTINLSLCLIGKHASQSLRQRKHLDMDSSQDQPRLQLLLLHSSDTHFLGPHRIHVRSDFDRYLHANSE